MAILPQSRRSVPPEDGGIDPPEDLFDVAHRIYRPHWPAASNEVLDDRLGLGQVVRLPEAHGLLVVVLALDEGAAAPVTGPPALGRVGPQVIAGLAALADPPSREP